MRVVGNLDQADDASKGKVSKGSHLPSNGKDGDVYTLVTEQADQVYIHLDGDWVRLLTDGTYIDAGEF